MVRSYLKQKELKRKKRIEKISVRSAITLNEEEIKRIKNVFGEDKIYDIKVDESLVGGISIKSNKDMIDGTIKKHLDDLKNSLDAKSIHA